MTIGRWIAAASVIGAAILFFAPVPAGLPPVVMRTGAIVTLTIGLLATVALPEYLTALIFFFLCVVVAVAPPEVVFSGFLSGAVWLVLGGLIIGVALESTGLGARIAGLLERRCAGSYFRVVFGTVTIMALLAFLMPSSMGRITIMLPIVLALADRLGFAPGTNGRNALVLAVAMGTLTPTFAILPASVPNVVLAGAAEAVHAVHFTYSKYLVLHFPVIGFVSILALPVFLVLLFPDRVRPQDVETHPSPLTGREIRLLVILVAALALWATDTLHGISPAWVSLGAAILCVMPRVGVAAPEETIRKVNFSAILFLAGFIGMGAVITHTGLGRHLGTWLIGALSLEPNAGVKEFAALIGLGVVLQLVTTLPGQPAIMTAFADTLAKASGLPLETVLMTAVAAWALVMFPYQAPPLVATRAISGVPVSAFIRLMLSFALFGWIVMVPLQYLWWRLLGYLP